MVRIDGSRQIRVNIGFTIGPRQWKTGSSRVKKPSRSAILNNVRLTEAVPGYLDAQDRHFLGYRIDGTEFGDPALSIYVGYNGWQDRVNISLPSLSAGHAWFRAGDTAAWMENQGNFRDEGREDRLTDRSYTMDRRSVLVLIEK